MRDDRGKVITLTAPPRRIVSITPSNTEILFALGLGPKIVGDTDYCDYPAAARSKPKVGGVVLNYEKILSLKPDLVIAKYDIQKANIERLEKLGIRVFAVNPFTVNDTLNAIEAIGRVTGTLPKAKGITAAMRRELSQVKKISMRDKKTPRVLTVVQKKPLIVIGPKTFIDDAIRWAGGRNLAFDARQPYPQFSLESAIARKPDVVLLSAAKPDELYTDPAWRTTPAVQHRRVYNPAFMQVLERPGPRLAHAVRQLTELLHPKL
jgi:iron complex transport system substrate-binding protein